MPVEPGEDLGEEFITRPISDIKADVYKTVVKVKDRPLSVVAQHFLKFYFKTRNSQQIEIMMKQYIFSAVCLMSGALCMSSCNEDKQAKPYTPDYEIVPEYTNADTWTAYEAFNVRHEGRSLE